MSNLKLIITIPNLLLYHIFNTKSITYDHIWPSLLTLSRNVSLALEFIISNDTRREGLRYIIITSMSLIFLFCVVVSMNSLTALLEHWKTHYVIVHPLIQNILITISITLIFIFSFISKPIPIIPLSLVHTKAFGSFPPFIWVNLYTYFIIKKSLIIDILVGFLWVVLLVWNIGTCKDACDTFCGGAWLT